MRLGSDQSGYNSLFELAKTITSNSTRYQYFPVSPLASTTLTFSKDTLHQHGTSRPSHSQHETSINTAHEVLARTLFRCNVSLTSHSLFLSTQLCRQWLLHDVGSWTTIPLPKRSLVACRWMVDPPQQLGLEYRCLRCRNRPRYLRCLDIQC